jgi:O-antigen biosynthesis protein
MPESGGELERRVAAMEQQLRRVLRRQANLDQRLLAVENSRLFRALRLLHPLFLKLGSRRAADLYQLWVEHERPPAEHSLDFEPLISIILPVHNPRREWLEAAVDSVTSQTYGRWQLCVCDDASRAPWIGEYFVARAAAEPRIRCVRSPEQLGISGASNMALQLAEGEYTAFLDQDDVLAPFALYSIAEAVQDRPADLLYSDHDYLNSEGRRVQPLFKPAYSPDLLYTSMYFGHLLVVRTDKLREAGGLRPAYDGSQDYDLALRLTENSAAVLHIPRMLYHWRQHAGSTALDAGAKPFTQAAGYQALSEVIARRDPLATVEAGPLANTYRVRWPAPVDLKASLIICSRNAKLLARCLQAIERRTYHPTREIVVVEHRSAGTAADLDRLLETQDCQRVPYTGPFHYAIMNNLGARRATGEVLVFLNDDVEPLKPQWLAELLSHARRPEVGIVGAKLLYPSGAIQHAGVAVGIMDGAGHPFRHLLAAPHWTWLQFPRNVSAVTGACLAVRREVFEELDGFDVLFPVNYNDVDLCLRAREAGYEVVLEPVALLRHKECQSRQPIVRVEESDLLDGRWDIWRESGDPFLSPYLSRTSEEATLEIDEVKQALARDTRIPRKI